MERRASRPSSSDAAGRGRPALHRQALPNTGEFAVLPITANAPAAFTLKEIILEEEEYSHDTSSRRRQARNSSHPWCSLRRQLLMVAWSGRSAADHPRGIQFQFLEPVDGN